MNVRYMKTFLKELARVPPDSRGRIEIFVFATLPAASSIIPEIGNVERMKGYSGYYKVRFGSYRLGMRLEENAVVLMRVLHRRDIYRYFP